MSTSDRDWTTGKGGQDFQRSGIDHDPHLLSGIKSALAIYGQPHFDRHIGIVTSVLRELGHAGARAPESVGVREHRNPRAREHGNAGTREPANEVPLSSTLLSDEIQCNDSRLSKMGNDHSTFYGDGGTPLKALPPDIEQQLLGIIRKSEEGVMGAAYDHVIDTAVEDGMNQHAIDEVMDTLLDKGLIYEPVLGRVKVS